MNSNSHPLPYSNEGKEQLQNIKTWTNWRSSCFSNIDSISSILFDFQTTELISQNLQPSQNPAKDPKRKSWAQHLHVSPMTLRFGSLPNWWSFSPHKSHLRRGGRTWYPDSNWNCPWTRHIGRIKLHNEPHCIRKSSGTVVKIKIPVHPLLLDF